MKRVLKSFFGTKKKPDQADLAHPNQHDQGGRNTSPTSNISIYQHDPHPISISRNNTRPLAFPNTGTDATNISTNARSLEEIKVYEERLQDLESRIAEVTEHLSHKIRLHNKALVHIRPDDERNLLQSPTAHDDEALPRRHKDKGKSREEASRPPELIPHLSSSRQGPRVPQSHRHSVAHSSAIDIPCHRESVYPEQDSFFDHEDHDSHTADTFQLSPNALRNVRDEVVKHDKDKLTTRKPVKRNASSYVSYDNALSCGSPSHQIGSSTSNSMANNCLHKDRMHSDTNTAPKAISSAPWQPHVVSPSQLVTTSSTGGLFMDHIPPPPPSRSRLSMMFGDRRDIRMRTLPWPQDHTSRTMANASGSLEEETTLSVTPIPSRRTSVDLDPSMDNTRVLFTQVKTARQYPLFRESHSTHGVHAKTEISSIEDDDIQQAYRIIHPYRTAIPDTSLHQTSMIMEPHPLSSHDPIALSSSPRTDFVAPGSPPQRLCSPISAASSRSNYLLSTSPISTVSSEQGTRRFSSATSRGTARRIIYSAELESGLPTGHIARESNYEVVGYRGDGQLCLASPRSSVGMASPSYASQSTTAQGLSIGHVEPATIVVRPGKGMSAQVVVRAPRPSSAGGKKGKGRKHSPRDAHVDSSSNEGYTTSCSSSALSRISKRRTKPRRKHARKARKRSTLSIGETIVQMTSSIFAERIRARIHAFLFQDSPRSMNHRKRLPKARHHRHQGHQGGNESVQTSDTETSDESTQADIQTNVESVQTEGENRTSDVLTDNFTKEKEDEEVEEEDEETEERSILSRRASAPPRLGPLSSLYSSSRACEFLQPVRPRSLYSVLRRISPSRYEQGEEKGGWPFITDAPLHTRCASYNTTLVGGMFPMELEEEQEQEEEPIFDRSSPSHMEQQLHEEENTENGTRFTQDAPSPSRPMRPVLINGLTCEQLLHSIRFESDQEGSPGYYGPAEYQRDEELRKQREQELAERKAQEALGKKKQGQETRKSTSEASSEVVAKVGGALALAVSTAWHTTALLASRIPSAATTLAHAAGSTTTVMTTSSSVAREEGEGK